MIQTIHNGVEIELELRQLENGNWIGECIVDPKGQRERFVPDRQFTTRELAKESALEVVRRHIENTR